MFVPHTIKKNKKEYSFNSLKPTHLFFKWYTYNIKVVNVNSVLLISRIYKKNLVKLL